MTERREAPFTLVSFHAHPDDEALLTAGTLARAAADGHRVVLVVATAGEAGLADRGHRAAGLATRRLEELQASAAALGVARVELLGYADSGWDGDAPVAAGAAFSTADVGVAAEALAEILRAERADVLTSYDEAGGYGHPDHVQVHHVAQRAALLAGIPVVLEATLDRRALLRAVRVLRWLGRVFPIPEIPDLGSAYTHRGALTHAVDVRPQLDRKRASMRAHASQASADEGVRTLALLLRLPRPVARVLLGREWFREVGRSPGGALLDDVFASLRSDATARGTPE